MDNKSDDTSVEKQSMTRLNGGHDDQPLLQRQEDEDGSDQASTSSPQTSSSKDVITQRYVINRVTHTEENFKKQVAGPEIEIETPTIGEKARNSCGKCSLSAFGEFLLKLFPIFTWLRHYDVKKWLPGDIVSGITVGIVHIPQSMAFSLLAGLPPVFGLYTSFYPVLIYTLMGTSRHISVGTFAVTSLLTQAVVLRMVPNEIGNSTINLNETLSNVTESNAISDTDARKVVVASTLMFLMGVFQLAFGVLRLGFITTYLSEPLVQAFTTGASFHIVTSLVPSVFGISFKSASGIGAIFKNWIEIFKHLPVTNVPTLVISIVCFVLLIAGREINMRYKDRMKIALPTEVIVVIIGTLASYFGKFQQDFDVIVVDNIPTGLPPPQLPDFSILGDIVADAFAVAIVGFAISVSVAKLYAQKYGYTIDSNQELVAYGVSNLIPAFFSSFPNAAALARCVIQDNTGGNTQLVGVISVVIVLITILALGPIFEPLPRCVLSSIIIVGLFGIIMQLSLLKSVFKQSRMDFVIWLVTLIAVLVLGVDLGLLASVIFTIFTVIARTQVPHYEVLGSVGGTDVYRSCDRYDSAVPYKGIVIFKFYSTLYYANKDYFQKKLIKCIGVDPDAEVSRRKKEMEKLRADSKARSKLNDSDSIEKDPGYGQEDTKLFDSEGNLPHTIIIDCSAFSFVDLVGTKALKGICKSCKELKIRFLLANVSSYVHTALDNISYYDVAGSDSEFVTIHDAALFALAKESRRDSLEKVTTTC